MIHLLAWLPLKKTFRDNQSAIVLGLAYLNRYYGVRFGGLQPERTYRSLNQIFYGQNVDILDRLIELGSRESNL